MGKLNRAEIDKACGDVERRKKDKPKIVQEYPAKNAVGPIVRYTEQGNPVKVWASHLDTNAWTQAQSFADMSFVHPKGLALMPDVHFGKGVPVGSVLPTVGAIVPAAVGTDIGCGVVAVRLNVNAKQLPDHLAKVRRLIERRVPLSAGGRHKEIPEHILQAWAPLAQGHKWLEEKHPRAFRPKAIEQLGTLGSGNHFIEVCLDESQQVWVMLHSGSRGAGSGVGQYFIDEALRRARLDGSAINGLGWLREEDPLFADYVQSVEWAQQFASINRQCMMHAAIEGLSEALGRPVEPTMHAINCFAGETKVLTWNGSFSIKDLAGQTHKLLTENGKWIEAPIKKFGQQNLMEITLSRSGVIKKIRATDNHRWILENVQRKPTEALTKDLKKGNRLQCSFPKPIVTKIDEKGVARGFVFGDGSSNGFKSYANFCGDKDEQMMKFFKNFKTPRQYKNVKRIMSLPLDWKKEYPSLDEENSILLGWLAGYFAADGDVGKTGRPTLSSANKENLEYVRVLCSRLGIGTFGIRERIRSGFGAPPSPIYLMGIMRGDLSEDFFVLDHHRENFNTGKNAAERRRWNVVEVKNLNITEDVYCAVVEGTHTFTLEDNILTSNCHHNYIAREKHYDGDVWVTRKGAIRAQKGDLGIIPSAMGQESFIVEGLGEESSFCSCSHGAGRVMSRSAAQGRFTAKDLRAQTAGVECRKDRSVVDEIPSAYKPIKRVMEDQRDLVVIKHRIKAVVCIKGV